MADGPLPVTREALEAWVEQHYPYVKPQEPRNPYRSGDDAYTDERNTERAALEDLIDALVP